MTEVCIIAAMAGENRVIGKQGNGFPWGRISKDMRHFRDLTTKPVPHPVIMGRKTWDSLPDGFKPLPDRPNLVVSGKFDLVLPEDCHLYRNIDTALYEAKKMDDERVFIIGGGQIYAQTIDRTDKLFLTLIEGDFEGDVFFPDYSEFKNIVSEEEGEEKGINYKFVELTR